MKAVSFQKTTSLHTNQKCFLKTSNFLFTQLDQKSQCFAKTKFERSELKTKIKLNKMKSKSKSKSKTKSKSKSRSKSKNKRKSSQVSLYNTHAIRTQCQNTKTKSKKKSNLKKESRPNCKQGFKKKKRSEKTKKRQKSPEENYVIVGDQIYNCPDMDVSQISSHFLR